MASAFSIGYHFELKRSLKNQNAWCKLQTCIDAPRDLTKTDMSWGRPCKLMLPATIIPQLWKYSAENRKNPHKQNGTFESNFLHERKSFARFLLLATDPYLSAKVHFVHKESSSLVDSGSKYFICRQKEFINPVLSCGVFIAQITIEWSSSWLIFVWVGLVSCCGVC